LLPDDEEADRFEELFEMLSRRGTLDPKATTVFGFVID
jgi:hypothetical protein